jgi:hypothetical protein
MGGGAARAPVSRGMSSALRPLGSALGVSTAVSPSSPTVAAEQLSRIVFWIPYDHPSRAVSPRLALHVKSGEAGFESGAESSAAVAHVYWVPVAVSLPWRRGFRPLQTRGRDLVYAESVSPLCRVEATVEILFGAIAKVLLLKCMRQLQKHWQGATAKNAKVENSEK